MAVYDCESELRLVHRRWPYVSAKDSDVSVEEAYREASEALRRLNEVQKFCDRYFHSAAFGRQ